MTNLAPDPYKYNSNYKRRYGLTRKRFRELLEAQGYRCAICRCLPGSRALHVDHEHATGKVRGLLCGRCNSLIGFCRESPRILAAAIVYLEDHGISYLSEITPQPGFAS